LLTSARKEAGLTQAQLAAALDRPQSYVSKYENGERSLDVIEFVAVCEALGQTPSTFLERVSTKLRPASTRSRRPRTLAT